MSRQKSNSVKIQVTISPFHDFVIRGLTGPYGELKTDVVKTIIRDWIKANDDELKRYNITYADFEKNPQLDDDSNDG